MKLQVLVAAMNTEPKALAEKMRLQTDALIINQCDHFAQTEYTEGGKSVKCLSLAERGVGLSRNTALMRAEGDICLFSDEDIVFDSGYEKKVLDAFERNPDADGITFNFRVDERRATYWNSGKRRIRFYNYGRYPAYAIAIRRDRMHRAGVTFSLLFGGGAPYSAGEDSLFLHDCLKKGLHLYTETEVLGEEVYRESTWFAGYTEKFFRDRGVLYRYLYGHAAPLWALRFLLAKRKQICGEISVGKAFGLMREGFSEGRIRRQVNE